jgi:adenylate cyclase
MLKVNILQQNKIKRLLRFGLYTTAVFAVIFYITTNTIFIPHIISSFVYGVLLGVLEEISNHRRILALSLPLQFLFKIVGILLVFTLFSGALIFTISSLTEIHVPDLIKQMQSRQLASPIISALAVAFVISTIFQIERLVGRNLLRNYLKGRYRRPKKEIRVFLFMDLQSSTAISEKLGNHDYYSFLNDAIYQMSESIMKTQAEIYQYVGDEIVFSWPLEKGITNNNCLLLYEMIVHQLHQKSAHFIKKYGYEPKYRAAMHAGIVIAAEIGHIKKDIVYSGDVLNATSRLESLCKELGAEVLVSKSLFNLMDKKHEIVYEDLGSVSLKGKDEKVEIIKVFLTDSAYEEDRAEIEKVLKRSPAAQ